MPAYRTPDIIGSTMTDAFLEIQLSDGTSIKYPRTPINIGTVTSSYRRAGENQYLYEYTLDNRQVEMIRVGEFDYKFGNPIFSSPDGWAGSMVGWDPIPWKGTPPARIEAAKYSILSDYLPGPLYFLFMGKGDIRKDFEMPFKGRNASERSLIQQIDLQIHFHGDSVEPILIGPSLKPKPSEKEVRERIHQWIHEYHLTFLQPLDGEKSNLMETANKVSPTTEFERQVLDCVKLAIR